MSAKTHIPRRDERKARELADYKRENSQLKRTISRLRKELDNSFEAEAEAAELLDEYGLPEKPKCPECGSGKITYFETPNGKRYIVCTNCREWKKALE